MVTLDLLVSEIEFGLFLVEDNPSLTFLFFIALVLLTALGSRFAFYAHRNLTANAIESQRSIWRYFRAVGVVAGLYGLVGTLSIISSLSLPARDGLLLATTLLVAFTLRQIHFAANTNKPSLFPAERLARMVFIGAVFAYVAAVIAGGLSSFTAVIQGVSALAFVAYGAAYYSDQTTDTQVRGTLLDSLLRHLLPILTFAALASIVVLAIPFGLQRVVVMHVQVVFIIMTATAFMTATIKLQQNLAGM